MTQGTGPQPLYHIGWWADYRTRDEEGTYVGFPSGSQIKDLYWHKSGKGKREDREGWVYQMTNGDHVYEYDIIRVWL